MRNCILLTLIAFVATILASSSLVAQVTIGSGKEPNPGSLLDLKQTDETGVNSTLGLMPPRVELTDAKNLYPMFTNDADYASNTNDKKTGEDKNHVGLLVFNTNQCLLGTEFSRGIFVWNGLSWKPLIKPGSTTGTTTDVNIHTDSRDGSTFKARKFGTAGEWMIENLHANKYAGEGASIGGTPSLSTSTTDKTKRWAYPTKNGGSPLNPELYDNQPELGYLFNWYAASGSDDVANNDEGEGTANELATGTRGICPVGWHLPSDVEWNILEDEIRRHYSDYSSLTTASTTGNLVVLGKRGDYSQAMRAACYPIEIAKLSDGKSYSINKGGFAAYMSGEIVDLSTTAGMGAYSAFWTASSRGGGQAWKRVLTADEKTVDRNTAKATDMLSVRCKLTEEFARCGDLLRDREGNAYQTATFGNAGCWMTQNLISTKNSIITLVENVNSTDETEVYYAKPNQSSTDPMQGYLYTWNAAMAKSLATETFISTETSTTVSSTQGICPDGWVLPSEADWNILEEEIAKNPAQYSTNTTAISWAGKDFATMMGWRRPADSSTGWGQNMRSTKIVNGVAHELASKSKDANAGFAALLVGSLESGTAQSSFGNYTNIWTSNDVFTPIGGDANARYRGLSHKDNGVYRGDASKSSMLTVRCKLKD